MRFSAVAGGGVGRDGGGGGGHRVDQQQQQQEELKREVERLRQELQEQREACVVAKAKGDELQAAVEEVGGMHHLYIRTFGIQ